MRTTPHPTHQEPVAQSNRPSTRRLVPSGALAGASAAVCTTVVTAGAAVADVSLEINAHSHSDPRFGGGPSSVPPWASCCRDPSRTPNGFVVVTTVAAGLSLIPAIAVPTTPPPRVLRGPHLVAAAIIILDPQRDSSAVDNER